MKAVLDTNILIDYLRGYAIALQEITRYRQPIISRITWIEVLAGIRSPEEEQRARAFLVKFHLQEIDPAVAEEAVILRRQYRLRLPDAIILATAHIHGCQLITRNTRDFDPEWPEIRCPYVL